LLGRRVGVETWPFGTARSPLTARARLCRDVAPARKPANLAGLRSGSSTAETTKTTFAPSGRCGTSASVNVNGPRWLVAKLMSQPRAFLVGRICMMPALLSRPAIGNRSATISAAARRTLARSDKSQTTGTARRPICSMILRTSSSFLGSRPTRMIVADLASSSAAARPMPEVGPVTM
jgi:hypothetical protein